MKFRHPFSRRLLAGGVVTLLSISAPAALATSFFWDGGAADLAVSGDGVSSGGAGDWSTTVANWDAGILPHVVWPSTGPDNDAVFDSMGALVTLQPPVTVNDLTFAASNYVISGTGLTPSITVPNRDRARCRQRLFATQV